MIQRIRALPLVAALLAAPAALGGTDNTAVVMPESAGGLPAACWPQDTLERPLPNDRIQRGLPVDRTPPARVVSRPVAIVAQPPARSVRAVTPDRDEKLLALTFDLCEKSNEITGYDASIVELLRAGQVPATFYAGGKWMRSHPERTMQIMADPLFELGNHGWTHGNLRVLRGQELEDQIHWTQAQYELLREELLRQPCAAGMHDRIPPRMKTFRFPYGTCDTAALAAVSRAGLWAIQWDVVSGDPDRGRTAERMAAEILSRIRPGSIVVAHANRRGWHTAAALRTLIPAARQRGYRFMTVSQLLDSGTPVTAASCYEVEPGDNLRYDLQFGRGTE